MVWNRKKTKNGGLIPHLVILWFVLVLNNLTYGQSTLPKVYVTKNGPDNGMAELTAKIDKDSFAKNLVKVKYKWIVIDNHKIRDNITIWPDGSQIFFGVGTESRKIDVILLVTCLFEPAEVGFLEPIMTTIVVENNSPIKVTLPEGRFKASQKTYDLVMQNVPTNSHIACKSLAVSFSGISWAIAVGLISDVQDMLRTIKNTNNIVLNKINISPSDFQQWNKLYGDFIYDLYINKKLNTSRDWQDLMNETATGFAAVK